MLICSPNASILIHIKTCNPAMAQKYIWHIHDKWTTMQSSTKYFFFFFFFTAADDIIYINHFSEKKKSWYFMWIIFHLLRNRNGFILKKKDVCFIVLFGFTLFPDVHISNFLVCFILFQRFSSISYFICYFNMRTALLNTSKIEFRSSKCFIFGPNLDSILSI